ncbi:MAG: HD domain-containing protein [Bacteroidales bacterium]|nr:HD domain-containing protein [Bacteroidales bacterium]
MTAKQQQHVTTVERRVKQLFASDTSGHDWYHIERVKIMSLHLASCQGADSYICTLAALLHEHDDDKLLHLTGGKEAALSLLQQTGVPAEAIAHIDAIVSTLSFKGSQTHTPMHSPEGMCVQDADRLDALGAIGIARTFSYSGAKNRMMFNPETSPKIYASAEEYRNTDSSAIHHFYEKLLLLKDRMNTDEGRRIAAQRHDFMLIYLEQFYKEWGCKF